MPGYTAWLVIRRREQMLDSILKSNPRVNLEPRPSVSLTRIGDVVELRMENAESILDKVNKYQPLRAISSAPIEDILYFHGKVFNKLATRYQIQCDACNPQVEPSPYRQRFLSIAEYQTGVSVLASEATPINETAPEVPNLWLRPEQVNLSEGETAYLFGNDGPATRLEESFFLPPCREEGPARGAEHYYSPEFVALRAELEDVVRKNWAHGPDPYRDPVALTLMRLADDIMLRDVFLDGGMLTWRSAEGLPTEIDLHVPDAGAAGASWRAKTFCDPESNDFREWARPITLSLADDLRGLLPRHRENGEEPLGGIAGGLGLLAADPAERQNWTIEELPYGYNDGMHEEGSWAYLDHLHSQLKDGSPAWMTMQERVLFPAQARIGTGFADHDKAEKLFMQIAWRCPWPYKKGPSIDAWRRAFRRILMRELSGQFPRAEERVEGWNEERKGPSRLFTHLRCADEPHPEQFVVRYAGEPDDDEVSAWRLELPWRSVVQARTLILNSRSRSRLDRGYVLA